MYIREKKRLKEELPDKLYKIFKESEVVLAGGAITSIFTANKINDFDLFFRSEKDRDKVLRAFSLLSDANVVFETYNAKTIAYKDNIFQIILLDYILGEPKEIIDKFDFTITMGAFDFKEEEFIIKEKFLIHNSQKRLIYNNNSNYPIATLNRMRKYLNRGYTISGIDIIKLGLKIQNLKIRTKEDLKHQLMGIDLTYLNDFLKDYDNDEDYVYTNFLKKLEQYLG